MNNKIHTNIDPHETQKHILKCLLHNEECRYSDLVPKGMTTDHFNFHIKKLVDDGVVIKKENGTYVLTREGKEHANRFDTDSKEMVFEKQAKVGVLIGIIRTNDYGEIEYLIQKRLKQPFYGFHGFPGGKVKYGESLFKAAERELAEETGLTADLELVCVEHRTDVATDDSVLEDKFFYFFRATHPTGTLIELFDSGENMWLTEKQILHDIESYVGTDFALDEIKNHKDKNPLFREIVNKVIKY